MRLWLALGLLSVGPILAGREAAPLDRGAAHESAHETALYGLPLARARRETMRSALARLGVVPLRVDAAYVREFYLGIAAPWQHDIRIGYDDDGELFEVNLLHETLDGLVDTISALEARYGKPTSRIGKVTGTDALRVSWQRPDGVVVSVVRPEGVSTFNVEYVVTVKKTRYDATHDDTPTTAATASEPESLPAQVASATSEAATTSPAAPEIEEIVSGGTYLRLKLTAHTGLFLGDRSYDVDGCEFGHAFDRDTFRDFPSPFDMHVIEPRGDGSFFVKVAVRDARSDHVFEFDSLRSGSSAELPVREPIFGGGPPEFVRATFEVEESPLCVRILQVDETLRAIAERLVAQAPVTVAGIDLLPSKSTVTMNFSSIAVGDVLTLLADEAWPELELERKSDASFVFRKTR